MTIDKDPPIEPQQFLAGVKVVDIGDIRIARGLSRRPRSSCPHVKMIYDIQERRIWCEDCENNIEAFDAFKILVENYSDAIADVKRMHDEAVAATEHSLHLIACKNIEQVWRGKTMAIGCPHCKGGLLPEDFKQIGSRCSAEIERQRRKRVPHDH